jgi:DNA-binding CsgD family transcriptional regulator
LLGYVRFRSSAMFGRDAEVAALQAALKATQTGHGNALFIVGEGGIGKSRLAAAVIAMAGEAGMTIMHGRGSSVGRMMPFRPLIEALMSLRRSGEPIDIEELGPYRPILAQLVPDWGAPAQREIFNPLEVSNSLAVLAEAFLRLTALAGREQGCLLVLDDMQDADPESLAVIDYLIDNIGQQATMMLGMVRSEPSSALTLAEAATQRSRAELHELDRLRPVQVGCLTAAWLDCAVSDLPPQLIEQLAADSDGIPLLAEQLLEAMLDSGTLIHGGGEPNDWHITGELRSRVPATLTQTVAQRLDQFGPQGRDLLIVAAVLGQRFPLPALQAAMGLSSREVLGYMHVVPTAQFIVPDKETLDWYEFKHPLFIDAILALASPDVRGQAARRAADALEGLYPGLPGEWCQTSAKLRLQAGEQGAAGRLFAQAGRRALDQGAAHSAVGLLEEAVQLLTTRNDAQARAEAFASLLIALAEAGMPQRAVALVGGLSQFVGVLNRHARAQLHAHLAWAAAMAGHSGDGAAQLAVARELLDADTSAEVAVLINLVTAHLMLDAPGPDQVQSAEELTLSTAAAAENAQLPTMACQAWQLLGALRRPQDPDEATACLERARGLAVQHGLALEEIHVLVRLGNDQALRNGSLQMLEEVRAKAAQIGAVTARYQAEQSIAFYRILNGEFAAAGELIDQVLIPVTRLRLLESVRYLLLSRAVLCAHQGKRREMDDAFAELRAQADEHAQHASRAHGLARAWCALLEEDRPLAREELALALAAEAQNPTIFQLSGRYGLNLLLMTLDGEAGWPEYEQVVTARVSHFRWDRQFALFARAVLYGRAGQPGEAADAVEAAVRLGTIYPTARHIGLRLVSETAAADGWGYPADWLRDAEEYFTHSGVRAVTKACRRLMRDVGVRVPQRRDGTDDIPPELRAMGVTVREYEVLKLLTLRLSNREIAERLYLSPRTVEKYVAGLLMKTNQPNRVALSRFGSTLEPYS